MTAPARTVFLGTGTFALPIVRALAHAPEAELLAVVTAPPRPSGRRMTLTASPVGAWAEAKGIDQQTPRRLRDPAAFEQIAALEPELLVLADYGRLVPGEWLALPRHGALNIHPSLLPRHRGASPIPAAILAGDAETAVTLMRMDEALDTGPIVAQRRVPLHGDEIAPELEARLAELGAGLLADTLGSWLDGSITARPQSEEGASLTRPLSREDGRLDPALPAEHLERRVRAYQPWPGSFLEADGDRLVVWRASVAPAAAPPFGGTPPLGGTPPAGAAPPLSGTPPAGAAPPPLTGTLVPAGRGLALVTSDGLLVLDEVQRSGGRRIRGDELVRGQPEWIGRAVTLAP